MRRMMLAPMILLLGSTAAPEPYSAAQPQLGRWCGGDFEVSDRKVALREGYGPGGFAITTRNPQAQAFFNNGMQLAHGFAHKAAIRAFQEARRLDPECAMCAWGEAWSSGPTINYGIKPEEAKPLVAMVEEADKLAAVSGTVHERNLIGALKLRYVGSTGNRDFADAMDKIAVLNPADDAVATIAADARMIAADDWNAETMKRPVELLETVLARNPDYAPAIHFYIHATEGAGYPQRAEKAAERLGVVAPAASHLVHMPSHTYYWIGRYGDAATSNLRAVEIATDDVKVEMLEGVDAEWKLLYHGHNVHFGLGGALMSGDAEVGLKLARPMIAMAGRATELRPFSQIVLGEAYLAVARFGAAEEMLAIAGPGKKAPGAQALLHYARGEFFARQGDVAGMRREMRAIPKKIEGDKSGRFATISAIARDVLEGRAAMIKGKPGKAAELFARAAAAEEAKPFADFADPPLWWYPVRRDVAAALLAKGDAAGALAAADASLKRRPLDPVALAIRGQAQGKLGAKVAAARDLAAARQGWRGRKLPNGA